MNRILLGVAASLLLLSCDAMAQRRSGRRGMNVARMMERFDTNKDGKLTQDEVDNDRMWRRMSSADKDKDGAISKKEMQSMAGGRGRGGEAAWKFLAQKYDADKDGKVSAAEYQRDAATFKRLDRNKDGVLTGADWTSGEGRGGRRGGGQRGNRTRSEAPKEGQVAPDFTLTRVADAKQSIKLSGFAGDQPVALIFGSCT